MPTETRHGLPCRARLRRSDEFQAVFGNARRLSSPQFRLHVWQRTAQALPRLGVAVSKRVDKRAVARNLIKRLARESFRHLSALLPVGDYVLIAQPGASRVPAAQLRAQCDDLFQRASTLPPAPVTMPAHCADTGAPPSPTESP